MSIEKPIRSLVEEIRPGRTDRAILMEVARVVDSHTGLLTTIADQLTTTGHDVAELKGHVMRADSQGRQASSHDLEQDARIAQLDERVEVVETGWRLVGSRIAAFVDHPRTRQVAKIIWVAAVAYAGAKGLRVLP